jgi:excisionase family DNA binding protein
MSDELLSTEEAAAKLGVTVRWVQKLLRDQRLPYARKLGRQYLIRESDLAQVSDLRPGRPRRI